MKKNVVLNLRFGFGNQLFEYACAYALAKKYNRKLIIDLSYYRASDLPSHEICLLKNLNVNSSCKFVVSDLGVNAKSRFAKKIKGIRRALTCGFPPTQYVDVKQPQAIIDIIPEKDKHLRLMGWFQSYKYFVGYESDIRREFQPIFEFSKEAEKWIDIVKNDTNSVSVHVRRGDYLSHFGAVLSIDYYKQAIDFIKSIYPNSKFYFFSDDIDWVKRTFVDEEVYYVSDSNLQALEEFYVMAACKHNIIVNSSFSWRAAWMNDNSEKKVIAPIVSCKDAKWDENCYPNDWIKFNTTMDDVCEG